MALGFTTSSDFGSLNVLPDKGMTRQATPQVRRVNFGEGKTGAVRSTKPRADGVSIEADNMISRGFKIIYLSLFCL